MMPDGVLALICDVVILQEMVPNLVLEASDETVGLQPPISLGPAVTRHL